MIVIGIILGCLILLAVAFIFWFMRGSQAELKEAGVYVDPIEPTEWPFPVAMPQHDRAKKKPALKKATTVAKKKTVVKKPAAIKAKTKK